MVDPGEQGGNGGGGGLGGAAGCALVLRKDALLILPLPPGEATVLVRQKYCIGF